MRLLPLMDPVARRIQKPDELDLEMISKLQSEMPVERASAALFFAETENWKPDSLSRTAGIRDTQAAFEELKNEGRLKDIKISPTRSLCVHADVIKRLANRISVALRKQHELNPLRSMIDRKSFLSGFDYLGETALVEAVIDRMKSDNLVRLSVSARVSRRRPIRQSLPTGSQPGRDRHHETTPGSPHPRPLPPSVLGHL